MMLGMQQSLPQLGPVVAQQPTSFTLPLLNTTQSDNSSKPASQSCTPTVGGPLQVPLMKQRCMRPKLSLNTEMNLSHTRSFGKGSTSLRLDTLSAVSPTIRNTFSNAYVQPKSASLPGSRSATPVDTKQRPVLLRLEVPSSSTSSSTAPVILTPTSQPETTPEEESTSASSSSSSSSVSPESGVVPYSLPTHHRSILSNSLLPKTDAISRIRRMSKPLFPLPKKVTFKEPLQEEIITIKHVFSHYSLVECIKEEEAMEQEESEKLEIPALSVVITNLAESVQSPKEHQTTIRAPSPTSLRLAEFKFPQPSLLKDLVNAGITPPAIEDQPSPILFSSPQSMSASSSPVSSTDGPLEEDSPSGLVLPKLSILSHRPVHHHRHLKRDSSSSESSDDNESNSSCAHTPVAGRSKKRRMWVWTLGPLEGYDGPVESSSFGDELNVQPIVEITPPKPLSIITTDLSAVAEINIETSPEVIMKTDELLELDLAAQTPLPVDGDLGHDFVMVESETEVNEVNEMPVIQE